MEGTSSETKSLKIGDIVTAHVLQKIVDGYNPNLNLASWKVASGSDLGDNNTTVMYAVELNLKVKQLEETETENVEKLQVMLKTMPTNAVLIELLNEAEFFKKEATIYKDVLPMLEQVQIEAGIHEKDRIQAWPKLYAAHVDGQKGDFLAMENLKTQGYEMGNRTALQDFNHCSMVLQNLAKYHAISFAKFGGNYDKIVEAFPILAADKLYGKTPKSDAARKQFFTQSYKCQAQTFREIGEELVASRLDKLAEVDIIAMLGDLVAKRTDCAIINHGDCWNNNMLYKYQSRGTKQTYPVDHKFVDFQICIATSRLIDVFHFIMTSSNLQVLNEREQDLLMIYYAEFTSFSEKLGVNTKAKGLTLQKFLEEAEERRLYGVMFAIIVAPFTTADKTTSSDLKEWSEEEFMKGDEKIKNMFKSITKAQTIQRTRDLVTKHLPKCKHAEQFL